MLPGLEFQTQMNLQCEPTTATPDFKQYDALGTSVGVYERDEPNQHFRLAQRHLVRAGSDRPAFPDSAEVNSARNFLLVVSSSSRQRQIATYQQWECEPRTFFGEL